MTQEQEYIIMASGEIITRECIAAWAESADEDTKSLEAELLASDEIAKVEDYFSAKSTPS